MRYDNLTTRYSRLKVALINPTANVIPSQRQKFLALAARLEQMLRLEVRLDRYGFDAWHDDRDFYALDAGIGCAG